MNKLKIRKTTLVAIVIIAISFVGFKFLGGLKQEPKKDSGKAKIVKVDVINIKNENIKADTAVNGRLNSKYKIDVFTEVTGRLLSSNKSFKEGTKFNKGEVLLRLDDSNYRMTLNATRSSFHSLLTKLLAEIKLEYPNDFNLWENYITNFNPEQSIKELPKVSNKKEKSYLVSKNIYTQYFSIKAQEEQIKKYTIIAPFTGVIDNGNLNANTIIRAGQKLAEFINPNIFELEVGVSLAEISKIELYDKVILSSSDISGQWEGTIKRIGESIDDKTMTFKIYIEVNSKKLFEGMYLKGIVSSFIIDSVSKIPSNLIYNGKTVYTVNDSLLHFQKIQIIHEADNYSLVRGLAENAQIINHSVANAYEGMKITLN